jgi:hypothetical protein
MKEDIEVKEKECDHHWVFVNITPLWREYICDKCNKTKTVFRNLYPGY